MKAPKTVQLLFVSFHREPILLGGTITAWKVKYTLFAEDYTLKEMENRTEPPFHRSLLYFEGPNSKAYIITQVDIVDGSSWNAVSMEDHGYVTHTSSVYNPT